MSLYHHVTDQDMAFSGPHVWPKLIVDHAQDRFIHQRPELSYLVAKRRMLEKREKNQEDQQPEYIRVRILRVQTNKSKSSTKYAQQFSHPINYEDPLEDVREFLQRLRKMLLRCMPDKPLLDCSLTLRFYDLNCTTRQLLSWSARWL